MFAFHRHSFFPFVVILLSLALAGLIYWSVQNPPNETASITQQEVEPVDPDAYRDGLSSIVKTFQERMSTSQDDLDKLLATQTALAGLLELRVPAEFKDLHLTLAVALSQIEIALESDDRNMDEPLAQIAELVGAYPWLAS